MASLDERAALKDARIRSQKFIVQNRRLRYLELHPEYFSSSHLEQADPLLHDRLITRFLSPSERKSTRQSRPFGETLETQLYRAEARLAHASSSRANGILSPSTKTHSKAPVDSGSGAATSTLSNEGAQDADAGEVNGGEDELIYVRNQPPESSGRDDGNDGVAATAAAAEEFFAIERDEDERVSSREEGWEKWKRVMGERFVRGLDEEFDYEGLVDGEEGLFSAGAEESEKWFDEEEEAIDWVGEGCEARGETGVQDF